MNPKKTFIEALNYYHEPQLVSRKYLSDKRLTQKEKNVLKSMLLLREHSFEEIFNLLSFSEDECNLLESQRNLLLGIAHNNNSNYKKAIKYLQKSIEQMKGYEVPKRLFLALDLLFIAFRNILDLDKMEQTLEVLENAKRSDLKEEISLVRNKALYFLALEDYRKVAIFHNWLEKNKINMTESQLISFQFMRMEYFTNTDQIERYEDILMELKKYRKFNSGAFYKFFKTLGDYYCKNKPIYAYKNDFEKFPALKYQIEVLKDLEEGNQASAKKSWENLRKIDDITYGEDFKYQAKTCLFSKCLEKLLNLNKEIIIENNFSTKEDYVLALLESNNGALSKEVIFRSVWKDEEYDKISVLKLNKLISRLRKNSNYNIKSSKGFIILDSKIKESA